MPGFGLALSTSTLTEASALPPAPRPERKVLDIEASQHPISCSAFLIVSTSGASAACLKKQVGRQFCVNVQAFWSRHASSSALCLAA